MADEKIEKGDEGKSYALFLSRRYVIRQFTSVSHIGLLARLECALLLSLYTKYSGNHRRLTSYLPTVSWQWSGGRPSGTVAEVKEHGEVTIQSKRGNTIKKSAEPGNPAVHITRPGNDVAKRASELEVEEKHAEAGADGDDKGEEVEEGPKTGEKHERDEDGEGEGEGEKEDEAATKKQKTAKKDTGVKKKGRPAKKVAKKDEKANEGEEKKDDAPKKKGPGRPKKGETKAGEKKEKNSKPVANGNGIGSRTRSKKT